MRIALLYVVLAEVALCEFCLSCMFVDRLDDLSSLGAHCARSYLSSTSPLSSFPLQPAPPPGYHSVYPPLPAHPAATYPSLASTGPMYPELSAPCAGISRTLPGVSHPALVDDASALETASTLHDSAFSGAMCWHAAVSSPSRRSVLTPHDSQLSARPQLRSSVVRRDRQAAMNSVTADRSLVSVSSPARSLLARRAYQTSVRDRLVKRKPLHIKKPLNAFMLFMKEMRSKVVDECTLKESAAINQILGRKWHSLDRSEQARYYEMARREKLLHKQLFPGWTARDNYSVIVRRVKRKATMTQRSLQRSSNNERDVVAAGKKCRARYGLEHQSRWCKPCRRKKRCIRFVDSADECQNSTNLIVAPAAADSTSDVPGDVMMTSPRPGFPAADTVSKTAAGNSPLRRQTTLCDSSAQKNNNTSQPHWTCPQRGIPA